MALGFPFITLEQTFAASVIVNSPSLDASAFRSAMVDCHIIAIAGGGASVVFELQSQTLTGKAFRAMVTSAGQTTTGHSYLDYQGFSNSKPCLGTCRVQVQPNGSLSSMTCDVSATFN